MALTSKKTSGFTIVELILYMGVLSIFLLILAQMFSAIVGLQTESRDESGVESEARFVMQRLSYDVKRASAITVPATDGTTGQTLGLTMSGSPVTFAISNNALSRTDSVGTGVLTSPAVRVSDFTTTRIGNTTGKDTVRLYLRIESASTGNPEVKIVETTLAPR